MEIPRTRENLHNISFGRIHPSFRWHSGLNLGKLKIHE